MGKSNCSTYCKQQWEAIRNVHTKACQWQYHHDYVMSHVKHSYQAKYDMAKWKCMTKNGKHHHLRIASNTRERAIVHRVACNHSGDFEILIAIHGKVNASRDIHMFYL